MSWDKSAAWAVVLITKLKLVAKMKAEIADLNMVCPLFVTEGLLRLNMGFISHCGGLVRQKSLEVDLVNCAKNLSDS